MSKGTQKRTAQARTTERLPVFVVISSMVDYPPNFDDVVDASLHLLCGPGFHRKRFDVEGQHVAWERERQREKKKTKEKQKKAKSFFRIPTGPFFDPPSTCHHPCRQQMDEIKQREGEKSQKRSAFFPSCSASKRTDMHESLLTEATFLVPLFAFTVSRTLFEKSSKKFPLSLQRLVAVYFPAAAASAASALAFCLSRMIWASRSFRWTALNPSLFPAVAFWPAFFCARSLSRSRCAPRVICKFCGFGIGIQN